MAYEITSVVAAQEWWLVTYAYNGMQYEDYYPGADELEAHTRCQRWLEYVEAKKG